MAVSDRSPPESSEMRFTRLRPGSPRSRCPTPERLGRVGQDQASLPAREQLRDQPLELHRHVADTPW